MPAWTDPADPVSGTGITRSWAVTNVTNLLRFLRGITGNGDPPAAGWVARSLSTSLTAWFDLDGALDARVASVPPTYGSFDVGIQDDGAGFFDVSNPAGSPDGSTTSWHVIQTRHSNYTVDYRLQFAAKLASDATLWFRKLDSGGPTSWFKIFHTGVDGSGSGFDADLLDGQEGAYYATATSVAAIKAVPSGLIAAFANAAGIAPGWSRFTNLDGRIPVGAGTTFGQTFVEGASAGSSWAHLHDGSTLSTASQSAGSVNSGGGSTATPAHSHAISGNTGSQTWIPPTFAIVWAQRS